MKRTEGRSLAETPTWAVATVITLLVGIGFFIHGGLKMLGKWLKRTRKKHLLAALDKIREEIMVFGLLSLLMGHWIIFVAKICVKSSALSSHFYPCARHQAFDNHAVFQWSNYHLNSTNSRVLLEDVQHEFCPKDHQPFVSYKSLEQLHRFLLVLGVTHVLYSFLAIALAMIKIYSWRIWENQAKILAFRGSVREESDMGSPDGSSNAVPMRRLANFMFHHTSHPWSQHRVLVWVLCFSRQFWSSINQVDYMALRLGFVTTHQLPFTYDFHNYMLRSMEEEFRDIVGVSVPLWVFAISCILLGFHGTNIYLWISFLPAILILLIGTKLHRIVVKLAVEIVDSSQWTGIHQFNLRDELFWFGNPRLLLRLIQFVSFQNAFEMAIYLWSPWETGELSCFTVNRRLFVGIRLSSGIVTQFWCSFITFPIYVIITQMGSKFKKAIVSENVRRSLHGWRKKVRAKLDGPAFTMLMATSNESFDSIVDEESSINKDTKFVSIQESSSAAPQDYIVSNQNGASSTQCYTSTQQKTHGNDGLKDFS